MMRNRRQVDAHPIGNLYVRFAGIAQRIRDSGPLPAAIRERSTAKPGLASANNGLSPRLDRQLREDGGYLVANRLLAETETHADLHVVEALRQQLQQVSFAFRKMREGSRAGRLRFVLKKKGVHFVKTVSKCGLVLARDDARVPYEEGRRLAGLIRGARFVSLDSRNHVLLECRTKVGQRRCPKGPGSLPVQGAWSHTRSRSPRLANSRITRSARASRRR